MWLDVCMKLSLQEMGPSLGKSFCDLGKKVLVGDSVCLFQFNETFHFVQK